MTAFTPRRVNIAISALLCSLAPLAQAEDKQYRYVEAAYAYQSTDWGPYAEENTITALASVDAGEFFHAHLRYNEGDTFMPRGVQQKNWWTYGLGVHWFITEKTSLLAGVDRHELESQSNRPNQRGWEYKIGVRHTLSENWHFTLEAGEINFIVDDDTTFIVEAVRSFQRGLAATFRVRDYDKLDLSSYELGLRWQF